MRRKLLTVMLSCTLISIMLLTGCQSKEETATNAPEETTTETVKESTEAESSEEKTSYKFGVTVQSLSNQTWAGNCETMANLAKEAGNTLTYVSCDDTSAKQIEQIENFISSGCDVIMVHPSDPNAIEDVCKQARDAGIKVFCWDNEMTNSDVNWIIDNVKLGYMIGEQASEFINEKFENGQCEVAVLDYPQTAILLERENGILAALEEHAPNAKIVAQQPAIDAVEGMSAMETILQANSDVKVVCCIGGGGAVGANEAFKAAGLVADDIGVFAADATNEELAAILAGEACRMSVMITGTSVTQGTEVYNMMVRLANGETFEEQNIYRDIFPVNANNAAEYYVE